LASFEGKKGKKKVTEEKKEGKKEIGKPRETYSPRHNSLAKTENKEKKKKKKV